MVASKCGANTGTFSNPRIVNPDGFSVRPQGMATVYLGWTAALVWTKLALRAGFFQLIRNMPHRLHCGCDHRYQQLSQMCATRSPAEACADLLLKSGAELEPNQLIVGMADVGAGFVGGVIGLCLRLMNNKRRIHSEAQAHLVKGFTLRNQLAVADAD